MASQEEPHVMRRVASGWLALALFGSGEATAGSAEPLTGHQLDIGIREIAEVYRLDPALIKAVISVESDFNPRAVSPKGARGLMQLMPLTASELGVELIHDPWENIEGGARYLRERLDRFGGDLALALAAYNAGEGAVRRHGGIPPYPETRRFVAEVLARYRTFQAEATPPRPATPPGEAGKEPEEPRQPEDARASPPAIIIEVEEGRPSVEALALLEEGIRLEREGRIGKAAERYRKALARDSSLEEPRNRLGLLALRTGRLDDARQELEAALRLRPESPRLLNNLGLVFHLKGEFRSALALFRKAWESEPSRPESALNLALAYAQLGRRAEAKALLETVLSLAERLPEAHLNLGSLLDAEGDRTGAIRHYRRFLALTEGQSSALGDQVRERVATLGNP
jgi:Flp pilus assembly protein TadD